MTCRGSGNFAWQIDVVIDFSQGFWLLLQWFLVLSGTRGPGQRFLSSRLTGMLFPISLRSSANARGDPQLHPRAEPRCPNPAASCSLWVLLLPKDLQGLQIRGASPTAVGTRLYYTVGTYRLPCLIPCRLQGHTASLVQLSPAPAPVSSG